MNFVAAMLLLVMKKEEDAFWMLAVLVENVLFDDCYSENLYGCHVEQRVFKDLLRKKLPRSALHTLVPGLHGSLQDHILILLILRLATRLEEIEFDVSLVTTEWFLCLFAKSLPSEVR